MKDNPLTATEVKEREKEYFARKQKEWDKLVVRFAQPYIDKMLEILKTRGLQ